jgi:hypothetical protein
MDTLNIMEALGVNDIVNAALSNDVALTQTALFYDVMETALVMLGVFVAPIVMIIILVRLKNKERTKRYELYADLYIKALEKGVTLPENLFEPVAKKEKVKEKGEFGKLIKKPLNIGIIFMFVGIGIWFAFRAASLAVYMADPFDQSTKYFSAFIDVFGAIGFIPTAIGIAFVIIHFIQRKKGVVKDAE